jgi:hypothetical protein
MREEILASDDSAPGRSVIEVYIEDGFIHRTAA